MRIELRDGQWAELRERITHGQDKAVKKAWLRGKAEQSDMIDFDTTLVRTFLRSWNVLDPDGSAIPLDDPDAIERAPEDIVDTLSVHAAELWTGATVPNAPTPPSSGDSSSPAAE